MSSDVSMPAIVWRAGEDYRGGNASPVGEMCNACRAYIPPDATCYRSTYWEVLCTACGLAGDAPPPMLRRGDAVLWQSRRYTVMHDAPASALTVNVRLDEFECAPGLSRQVDVFVSEIVRDCACNAPGCRR